MLVYLNNFPSQNAVKGDNFEGNDTLKGELEGRGIIGEGEEATEAKVAPKVSHEKDELQGKFDTLTGEKDELQGKFDTLTGEKDELTEKVTTLEGENKTEVLTLEVERLVKLLEISIDLNKGKVPNGYTRVS